MPNSTTPPKHKTPNYRLVRHAHEYISIFGVKRMQVYHKWEPMPLRSTRKDLP